MAVVAKLRRDSTDISFKAGAGSGLNLKVNGWFPSSATPSPTGRTLPVVETLRLFADRATDDALATTIQSLDDYRKLAARYIADPTEEEPIWLHASMTGETGERRALVRKIEMEIVTDPSMATSAAKANRIDLILRIEREPWWEATTHTDGDTFTENARALITFDYTGAGSGDLEGDVRARFRALVLRSDASGAEVGRLWMGFRSANKHGTLANFTPIWDLERLQDAALETDVTRVDDATASVTVEEDETGATFGPTLPTFSLVAGNAMFRAQGVSLTTWEGVAGSDTPFEITVTDQSGDTVHGFLAESDPSQGLGAELLTDGALEIGGTGGDFNSGAEADDGTSDNWTNWTETNNDGNGDKTEATTTVHGGSYACKLIYGTAVSQIYQQAAATAGKLYKLVFWTRGDGTNSLVIRMFTDGVNTQIWQVDTAVTATSYAQKIYYVVCPAGETNLTPVFQSATAGTVYVDDVSFKEVTEIGSDAIDIVSARDGATQDWENIDATFDYNDTAYTFDVTRAEEKVVIAESGTDWDKATNGGIFEKALTLLFSDITADYEENFGDYLWLLRYKLAANATTWEVQLRWGYNAMDDADFVKGPVKEVSRTSWDNMDMGRMVVPLRDYHALILAEATDGFDATFAVQIWARRTSGAANLELDALLLVPIDEGWLFSDSFSLPAATDSFWSYAESPEAFRKTSIAFDSSNNILGMAAFSGWNFGPPPGDGRLVIVYAGATAHDITLGIYGSLFRFYQRWITLRGAE